MEIRRTAHFDQWLEWLRDRMAVLRITARIGRLALGNPGDAKPVGDGISEMRIDYGPGYRVYFLRRATHVVVLLCGGDKSTQQDDIALARQLARQIRDRS
jgi:putative addiction module killer protein